MIEKIKRVVCNIHVFLLVAILAIFALSVENASADPVFQGVYNQNVEQEEAFRVASHAQRPDQQDAEPKEMKNNTSVNSMMGMGNSGNSWMWTCIIIVLMVVLMV